MIFVFRRFGSLLALVFAVTSLSAEEMVVDFSRDIRPILSENCFFCHGPDANQRQADLRMDTRDGALSVIEAGNSTAGDLIERLLTDDDDLRMPPANSNRAVSAEEVDLIRKWIDQGAEWEKTLVVSADHQTQCPQSRFRFGRAAA